MEDVFLIDIDVDHIVAVARGRGYIILNGIDAVVDEQYNADRLTKILRNVSDIIGAHVLNVASQDYDPQGASVTILISEEEVHDADVVCHLDKSHLTVHTYPESHPQKGIMTFRADIDVSTCGRISPLNALNYLLDSFDSDIVTLDYRVRGFTRDVNGKKLSRR